MAAGREPDRHAGNAPLHQEGIVVNLPSLRAHVPELDAYIAEAGGDERG